MSEEFAFSAKHPHVPKTERWLVSLSDGRTLFQDQTPGLPSAWTRLKEWVSSTDVYITNVRLEAYGRKVVSTPFRHAETGEKQVQGYWHSYKMGRVVHAGTNIEIGFMGIGYIQNDMIHITWIRDDGHEIEELRPLYKENKSGEQAIDMGAILQ